MDAKYTFLNIVLFDYMFEIKKHIFIKLKIVCWGEYSVFLTETPQGWQNGIFPRDIYTCDDGEFAHFSICGEMFQWCHHKEETSIITLARYSSHPWLFLPLISFSLCLLLCLSCSAHILYPPIPLVAAKTLTDKLQGRQRKRNGKRENAVERGSNIRKKKSAWHHSTYFSLFAVFPIFAFITPLALSCCFYTPWLAF